MPSNPGTLLKVFCDESRQTAHRYMLLGGVIATASFWQNAHVEIGKYRNRVDWPHAFKWGKVSGGTKVVRVYKGFVDYLFDHPKELHYKSLVLDTSLVDKRRDDKETRFYKIYYQLLVNSFGAYANPNNPCDITLHQRITKYNLTTLKDILNNGMRKKYGCPANLILSIRHSSLENQELLQITDVLTGAIGFELHGYHRARGACAGKIELMNHILRRADLTTFANPTDWSKRNFSIWHFRYYENPSAGA